MYTQRQAPREVVTRFPISQENPPEGAGATPQETYLDELRKLGANVRLDNSQPNTPAAEVSYAPDHANAGALAAALETRDKFRPQQAPEPAFEEAISKLKEAGEVLKKQPGQEQESEPEKKQSLFGGALDRLKEAAQVLIKPQEKPDQVIVTTPGKPGMTHDEAREQFIAAAKIVANVLRENGKGLDAARLVEVSRTLEKTTKLSPLDHENIGKSVGSAEQIHKEQAAAIEKLKEASQALTAGQQPGQATVAPEGSAGTQAKKKDDGVGLLDITVKSNPINSFTSNFGAHFDSQKGSPEEQKSKGKKVSSPEAPAATTTPAAAPTATQQAPVAKEQSEALPAEQVSTEKIQEPIKQDTAPAATAQQNAAPAPAPAPAPAAKHEQPTPATAFTKTDIPVELLDKMGMSLDKLQQSGQLDKLLRGEKTDLINTFAVHDAAGQAQPFAAKLVLHRDQDGTASLKFDLPKKELEIPKQVMGKELSPEVRKELETTGRGPLLVFKDAKGQEVKAYIGVDKEMNKVVLLRQDAIRLPDTVRGVVLNKEQREMMTQGKPVKLTGLSNTPGTGPLYNATVQIDAARKGLSIKADNAQLNVTPASKQDVKPAQANTTKQTEKVAEDVKPKGPKMRR